MNPVKPDRLLVAFDCDRARKRLRVEIEFDGFADPDRMYQRMRDTLAMIEEEIAAQDPYCECHEMEAKFCQVHGSQSQP